MERAMKRLVLSGLCAAMVLLAGCRKGTTDPAPDLVSGTGTMLVTGDCYTWHVRADAGELYELLDLSQEFRHSGIRVRFTLKERSDVASCSMMGGMAEVVSMTKL
jgi:hypothetical protein